MKTSGKYLIVLLSVLSYSVSNAAERGDFGYVCYDSRGGFLWSKMRVYCEVVITEELGSKLRVEFLERCSQPDKNEGQTKIVWSSEFYKSRDECLK